MCGSFANHLFFIMTFVVISQYGANAHERQPFVWSSCGTSSDPITIESLNMYQNDSNYLYADGSFSIAFNMSSPIQAKVFMKKNLLGLWVPIPCLNNVGTCNYDDICALSPYETDCPKYYTDHNLPCRCPFLQGTYSFKALPVDVQVLPKWIESGLYSITIKLYQGGKQLICLKMTIDLW